MITNNNNSNHNTNSNNNNKQLTMQNDSYIIHNT